MRSEADFREALSREKCWDLETEAVFLERGEPVMDCLLQNREELIALCQFIERRQVRSYLEIGLWTGRTLGALHSLFDFDLVAGCDQGFAETFGLELHLPAEASFFRGDSWSDGFLRFRRDLGPVDLVMIDADHRYQGVRGDFERNRRFPHRFLAFHDICGARSQTRGVRRFWQELEGGHRLEIIRPHLELGLEGSTMGIGLWSEGEDLIESGL